MPTNSHDDRWLLPRRQTEYPTWNLLPEATIHGRREATYLVLAAVFLVATAALLLLGTSRVIDVSSVLAAVAPEIELPVAMLLPFGAIPFALGLLAITLVCELYGRRRATALVWVGLVASVALVGLMRLGDVIDGGDALGASLAFAACYLVAHTANVVVFDAMRRRTRGRKLWLRLNGAALLALLAGWGSFGLAAYAVGQVEVATVVALSIGGAAYSIALVLVLGIPLVLATRGLALFLRVGRHETPHAIDERGERIAPAVRPSRPALAEGSVARKLPPAVIVEGADDPDAPIELPRRRAARASIQPYSSAELRFFTEGDQLGAD